MIIPAILGTVGPFSGAIFPAEPGNPISISQPFAAPPPLAQQAQTTSVSRIADVLPSDWAFQALQGLIEHYGCIQGYPDLTFRGQQSLTRFEYAAALNACLDTIATLAAQNTLNSEDLETLQRLQADFQGELAALGHRVNSLEAEVTNLRAQQFSTTTTLDGEVSFNLGIPVNGLTAVDSEDGSAISENSVSIAARARLTFEASLTGDDYLRLRLQGGDGEILEAFGGLADSTDSDYDISLTDFFYSLPLSDQVTVILSARGVVGSDWVTSTIVPFDGPAVANAASPGFYSSGGGSSNGAGVGVSLALTDALVFDAGFTASNPGGATDPAIGLLSASNQSYIAQLSYLGDSHLQAALVYMHNDQSRNFEGGQEGATNTFAGLINLDFGNFFLAGYSAYQTFNSGSDVSWAAGLGLEDIWLEGAKFGIYGGQSPQLQGRINNPFFMEGYYEIPINQLLSITPAIVYGEANFSDPEGAGLDNTSLYGVIRATFEF